MYKKYINSQYKFIKNTINFFFCKSILVITNLKRENKTNYFMKSR